eukprot:gene10388-21665_t
MDVSVLANHSSMDSPNRANLVSSISFTSVILRTHSRCHITNGGDDINDTNDRGAVLETIQSERISNERSFNLNSPGNLPHQQLLKDYQATHLGQPSHFNDAPKKSVRQNHTKNFEPAPPATSVKNQMMLLAAEIAKTPQTIQADDQVTLYSNMALLATIYTPTFLKALTAPDQYT